VSTVTVNAPATLAVGQSWLHHPTNSTLSMPVLVQSLDTETQPITQTVNYVLSRARPVVVNDGARKSRTGNLTVVLRTIAERVAWVALTTDGSPLKFTCPAGWGWEFSSAWMSLGVIAWTNPAGFGRDPYRLASAPFVLVDPPSVAT
jgi:hypothetical protein